MPRRLSPAKLAEARECYAIYGHKGGIPIAELGNALRALGINTTNSEMRKIVADIGSPPSVNFDLFQVKFYTVSIPLKRANARIPIIVLFFVILVLNGCISLFLP